MSEDAGTGKRATGGDSSGRSFTPAPGERRGDGPRKVRHGLKLRHREPDRERSDLARRWIELLDARTDVDVRPQGWEYAVAGQVASLEIEGGQIRARVQGRASKPYRTTIALPILAESDWERVVGAMAQEAVYVAKLLGNELPEGLEELFRTLGLQLLPGDPHEWAASCSCPRRTACKHVAAVGYVVAERLEEQPLLVFSLRGMAAERVLDRLRQVRAMHTHGVASAHSDPMIPESQIEPPPLEATLEEFWRSGRPLRPESMSAPAPHALLRRLGPSPLRGRFPLVGLLASVYDTVAEHAILLRDHAEHIDELEEESESASS